MEFFDVISERYSVRGFTNQEVEKEKLDKILEAARIAPTGVNKEQYDDLKAWVDLFRGQPNVSADNIAVWYYSYSTNNIIPVFQSTT